MPDYNKLLQASLPDLLDAAVDSINFEHDDAESLLGADVSDFEQIQNARRRQSLHQPIHGEN